MDKKEEIRNKKRKNVTLGIIIIWLFCIILYLFFINYVKIPYLYKRTSLFEDLGKLLN